MTRLRVNKTVILLAVLILVSIIIHIFLAGGATNAKGDFALAPCNEVGREVILNQRPAWFLDAQDRINLLTLAKHNQLEFNLLTTRGQVAGRHTVALNDDTDIGYIAGLGIAPQGAAFLITEKEDGLYRPSLVCIMAGTGTDVGAGTDTGTREKNGSHSVRPFDLLLEWPRDIAGVLSGGELHLAYVLKDIESYKLYYQKCILGEGPASGANRSGGDDENASGRAAAKPQLISSAEMLGLPAMIRDHSGRLHITWKEKNGTGTQSFQYYVALNPEAEAETQAGAAREKLKLGQAAVYFGGQDGQRVYIEDVGPSMSLDPDGAVYITWNFSFWHTFFNTFDSKAYLAKVTPNGTLADLWTFQGKNGFAVAGDVTVNSQGEPVVFWEDFNNRRVFIYWSRYDTIQDKFSEPERFIPYYGSHRLVSAGMTAAGDMLVFWKQLGSNDTIFMRNSSQAILPQWINHWSAWIISGGVGGAAREIVFIVLYSLAGAVAFLGVNIPVLALFLLIYFLLERYNILVKVNFLLMLSISIILLVFLKTQVPAFYVSATSENGIMLIAILTATLASFLVGHKHWFEGGEEITYLRFIVIWIFCDSFLSLLSTAPGMFAP